MRPGPFGVALGVVLVVSLLPAAWIAPWTHRASELVGLPLVPLGDGWMAVRHWLVRQAERVVSSEDALRLDDENRLLRLELSQSREDVRELRRQLELYQGEEVAPGRRVRFIDARVVGSEPHASGELLHRINAGTARGVAPGTQVVTRRNVLLGEVVEVASGGTGRTVSYVRPLTSRQSGRFEGRILRDGETDVMEVMAEGTGLDADAIAASLPTHLKLKGRVTLHAPGTLPRDGLVIEDRRRYDT